MENEKTKKEATVELIDVMIQKVLQAFGLKIVKDAAIRRSFRNLKKDSSTES